MKTSGLPWRRRTGLPRWFLGSSGYRPHLSSLRAPQCPESGLRGRRGVSFSDPRLPEPGPDRCSGSRKFSSFFRELVISSRQALRHHKMLSSKARRIMTPAKLIIFATEIVSWICVGLKGIAA
jgi:hypothetical protein